MEAELADNDNEIKRLQVATDVAGLCINVHPVYYCDKEILVHNLDSL